MAGIGVVARRWGPSLVALGFASLFLWLGINALITDFVWTSYPATVGRCLGGRNNMCEVAIQTGGRVVNSYSYVGAEHKTGDHVVASASGPPPWSQVQAGTDGWIAWMSLVLLLGGGMLALGVAGYAAFRSGGRHDRARHRRSA